jgi:hypothetical protein
MPRLHLTWTLPLLNMWYICLSGHDVQSYEIVGSSNRWTPSLRVIEFAVQ